MKKQFAGKRAAFRCIGNWESDIPRTSFTESDVLTPAMREQIEAFYGKVDADLFESEHQAHMKLCRDLAAAARKRGEEDKARRIELKARVWAEKHCKAFFADLGKGVAR